MMNLSSRAAATAFAAVLLISSAAFAQTAAPAPAAAPAAKMDKKPVEHTAASLECSKEADAKGLHGKEQKLYAEDLLKYMRQLPDATRVIFNLSVIDGYSHKEIGEQLQITESTSRWHLSEAKKKLRVLLQAGDTGGLMDNNKAT